MPNSTVPQPSQTGGAAPSAPSEPMVSVKKADGTIVKMPLSRVREMKKSETGDKKLERGNGKEEMGKRKQAPANAAGKLGNEEMNELRTTSTNILTTNSRQPANEPATLAEGIEMILKAKREIGSLTSSGFSLPAQAGVQSSEVSGNGKREMGKRKEEMGKEKWEKGNEEIKKLGNEGMNKPRTASQKSEVSREPSAVSRKQPSWQGDDHKSLLDDSFHKEDLPMVIEARRQALAKVRPTHQTITPAQQHSSTAAKQSVANEGAENLKPVTYNLKPAPKPIMHDVLPPPAKRSLGPVDELRSFTLEDLRHLDVTPAAAASKLGQKFETLKEESYLLYMEAVAAWRMSPLYRAYQAAVRDALERGQPLSQVIGGTTDRAALKLPEWQAVAGVNKMLV